MAFILLIVLFVLAWIVLILPKQRELKRHNALVASLEVGDEVMTGSGFYGTLTQVDTDTVRIRLAEGVEVTLARRAVAAKVVDTDTETGADASALPGPRSPEALEAAEDAPGPGDLGDEGDADGEGDPEVDR